MNEQKIFRIDDQKLDLLRQRALNRNLRLVIPIIIISTIIQYYAFGKDDIQFFGLITLIIIPMIIIPVIIGTNKLKKSFKSYEIILDKDGVELKAEMVEWQKILWSNMIIEEKDNGTINLFDKHVPKNKRKFNGKGWITIQPEIEKREELLKELKITVANMV